MKRVFVIHGWGGSPENCWFPWLKRNLEDRGYKVYIPQMPDAESPKKSAWLKVMLDLINNPDENTYLVGHSMGCQAIQRYLENLEGNEKIGGVVLVAGWINDPKWEGRTKEEEAVIHDWFDVLKDYSKMRDHCKKFVSIYSTNDPYILESNWKEAENELGSELIILENKGHFDDDAEVKELREVLESILKFSQS